MSLTWTCKKHITPIQVFCAWSQIRGPTFKPGSTMVLASPISWHLSSLYREKNVALPREYSTRRAWWWRWVASSLAGLFIGKIQVRNGYFQRFGFKVSQFGIQDDRPALLRETRWMETKDLEASTASRDCVTCRLANWSSARHRETCRCTNRAGS